MIERMLNKINISPSGCWEWTASKDLGGYGKFRFDGKVSRPHRFIYEYYHGEIDSNLVIDHLCRVRHCVNPHHLEAVTQKENVRRGISANHIKTQCPQGHVYSPENTRIYRNRRNCRKCSKHKSLLQRQKLSKLK